MHDLLLRALHHDIITREQYDAILALDGAPGAPEAPRGMNWISVAYFAGALIVIFALGWFLVDQWDRLGAGGVLVVALLYGALFIGTAWYLLRAGYRTAGGLATALAVSTTPLIVWALENLTGIWVPWRLPLPFEWHGDAWESGRWTIVQLATIGSALFALQRVRFPFLTAFIAVPAVTVAFPLAELLFGRDLGYQMREWMVLLFGGALFAVAYVVDQHDDEREGFAFWLYLCASAALFVGIVHLFGEVRWTRHLAPLFAIIAFAAALYLRQRVFLVAGGIALFWYLGYLAFEVFRETVLFPIALATIGLLVLLATVWLQRAFPRLVERVAAERGRRPSLPGGRVTALAPFVVALALLVARFPMERARVTEWQRQNQELLREQQGQRPPARP
jgi:hypothetical protein